MKQNNGEKSAIECVGIIMDGNRRWAREHSLPVLEGHRLGYEKFKEVVNWAKESKVKYLIFYAFSTENWNRSTKEVEYLMSLFKNVLMKGLEDIHKEKVRMRFIGQREQFSKELQERMSVLEEKTAKCTEGTVVAALSYGGRAEIVDAVNNIIKEKRTQSITEKEFRNHMWSHDIPDPDLIIRTGGAMRLSNFLTWQSAYSELFFSDTYWPDFDKKEFESIFEEYYGRERRMGI